MYKNMKIQEYEISLVQFLTIRLWRVSMEKEQGKKNLPSF